MLSHDVNMNFKRKKIKRTRGKDIFEYVWGFKKSFIKDYKDRKEFKKKRI